MSEVRVIYTALAGLTPPRHDMVIRFGVAGHHGRLFRVTNHPKADKDGTFTVELEPLEPVGNDEPAVS